MPVKFDPTLRPDYDNFRDEILKTTLQDVEKCMILSIFENIRNFPEFGTAISASRDLTPNTKNVALNAYKVAATTLNPAKTSSAATPSQPAFSAPPSVVRAVSEKLKGMIGSKGGCYIQLHELGLNIAFERGGDCQQLATQLDLLGITPQISNDKITNNFGTFPKSVVLSTVQDIYKLLNEVCQLEPAGIMNFVIETEIDAESEMAIKLMNYNNTAAKVQNQMFPPLPSPVKASTAKAAPAARPLPPQPKGVQRKMVHPKGMPTTKAQPSAPAISDPSQFPPLSTPPGFKMLPIPAASKQQPEAWKVLTSIPEFKANAHYGKGTQTFTIDVYMHKVMTEGYHSVFEFGSEVDNINFEVQELIPVMIEILKRPSHDNFRKNAIKLLTTAFQEAPSEQFAVMMALSMQYEEMK